MTIQAQWKRLMADTRASETFKNTEFQTEIIIRFIYKMKEKKISQADLAKKTGLHPSYLSRVFSVSGNLTLTTLRKIADALDVEIEFRLNDKHGRVVSAEELSQLVEVAHHEAPVARVFMMPDTPWRLKGDQNESFACSA